MRQSSGLFIKITDFLITNFQENYILRQVYMIINFNIFKK